MLTPILPSLLILLASSFSWAADSPCSMETLCQKYREGYENARSERIRASFPEDFDWKSFDQKATDTRLYQIFYETKQRLRQVIDADTRLLPWVRANLIDRMLMTTLSLQSRNQARYAYRANFWADTHEVLAATSLGEAPEATVVNIFAHELSHSFDQSALTYYLVNDFNLNESQVFGIDDPHRPGSEKLRSGELHRHVIATPVPWEKLASVESSLQTQGVLDAQMSEAMSDAYAAKVTALYLQELDTKEQAQAAFEGVMDLLVGACQDEKLVDQVSTLWPTVRNRIETIYFGNPMLAQFAGCNAQ